MKPLKIVSIVPALPPKVNGLGDFAYFLAKSLKDDYKCDTIFLKTDSSVSQDRINNFIVESIPELTSDQLFSALHKINPDIIMVHYVGYAYDPTGIPGWLLKGIRKCRAQNPGIKIMVLFHELYADGLPWQKTFWTKPFQKNIAFKLQELSDFSVTNTEITFNILKKEYPYKNVAYIPVFSNIQEPEMIPSYSERKNILVVFGSDPVREKLFKEHEKLVYWIKKLKIEQVIEMGPEREERMGSVENVPLVSMGVLSADKVSEVMLKSKFGIVFYPQTLLTKSGVFAAYASHGLVPIVIDNRKRIATELKPEEHYLSNINKNVNGNAIMNNVKAWYQNHNLKETTAQLYRMLLNNKY